MDKSQIESFKALIFDVDGTLADSMQLHNQAWIETLQEFSCLMTDKILFEYAGIPNDRTVEIFNERFGWNLESQTVINKKENHFRKNQFKLKPIDVVTKIVRGYAGQIPMAILSGGTRETVSEILKTLHIAEFFPIQVCAGDTRGDKSTTEPFELAAQKLGFNCKDCLMFEDGEMGIRSALKSVMSVGRILSNPHRIEFMGQS